MSVESDTVTIGEWDRYFNAPDKAKYGVDRRQPNLLSKKKIRAASSSGQMACNFDTRWTDLSNKWHEYEVRACTDGWSFVKAAHQSVEISDPELETIFFGLAKIWREATGGLSSTTRRMRHPTYQAIVRLGGDVVPFILRELEERPDWWFDALEHLTGVRPTNANDTFEKAVSTWIDWGKTHNRK